MPYKNIEERNKKALEYYYNNREKVLKYQKDRWKRKYQEDPEFRKKRQLRDKSRMNPDGSMGNLRGKKCSQCGSLNDLQRHHPSYKKTEFIILCRKCHNKLHAQKKKQSNGNTFGYAHLKKKTRPLQKKP